MDKPRPPFAQDVLPNVDAAHFAPPTVSAPAAFVHAPRFLILYGSLRERSYSRLLAFEAARLLEAMGGEVRIYHAHGLPLPDDAAPEHPKVRELLDLSLWSESHVWVSPERHGTLNAALNPATNAAPARIEIANPDGVLRANMFVPVVIAADLGRSGVTIPAAAVQQTEQGPIAFVRTGPDAFERRALRLGIQRPDWVEVEAGVADGETVATDGSFGLKAILLRSLLGSTD